MQMQKVKALVSLVIIVASASFLIVRYVGLPPKIDARPHIGIGQVLAEQAAKLAGTGGRIVLVAPDTSVFRYPGSEVQLEAFHSSLRKAGLTIAATNWVKLDPDRPLRVPPGDFMELLRKQSDSDVVVSLMGPPTLNPDQKAKLGQKHARIVALCAGDMPKQINLQNLFEENLLHAAVVSRASPSLNGPLSDDPQKWFEYLYQVVTARNVADLPSSARAAMP